MAAGENKIKINAMPTIKRIPKEKVAVLHICEQRDQIATLIKNNDKLSTILTGNGYPEDGYMYKVDEMGRDIKSVNEKLTGISGIVKELHEESIGKRLVVKTIKERRAEWIKVAMFIIGAASLVIVAWNSFKSSEKQDLTLKKVDDMGIPFVLNSRGEFIALPDSTLIRFLPPDSIKYTIIKDK
jgi:hypothetical protein